MDRQVKVKILDMTYDMENNLFQMHIEELVGKHEKIVLAVDGTDFGITKDFPVKLVEQFCQDMKGKEKNLHIQKDCSSIRDAKRNEEGKISQTEMERINQRVDSYPINKIMNNLNSELKEDVDEN